MPLLRGQNSLLTASGAVVVDVEEERAILSAQPLALIILCPCLTNTDTGLSKRFQTPRLLSQTTTIDCAPVSGERVAGNPVSSDCSRSVWAHTPPFPCQSGAIEVSNLFTAWTIHLTSPETRHLKLLVINLFLSQVLMPLIDIQIRCVSLYPEYLPS